MTERPPFGNAIIVVIRTSFDRGGTRSANALCRSLGRSAAILALCTSCAVSYTDGNGDHHVIGLADVTVRAPKDPTTIAGSVVEVTTIGVSVGSNSQGGYATIGFNRETTAALRNDALVIGNPIASLEARDTREHGEQK